MYRIRSVEDAQQRLFKTVLLHQGQPIYIDKVLAARLVEGKNLLTGRRQTFELEPSSTMPPSLGYLNYEAYAVFVRRRPSRRVRQGVCAENISCNLGSREELVRSSAFGKMLVNAYPSKEEAIKKLLQRDAHGVAFSKHFALSVDKGLYYEEVLVGSWEKDGKLILGDKFKCLQEMLDADCK